MNMHENARLTPLGRERLARAVLSGQTPEAAARVAGVCPRTARKWVARFRTEGMAGLRPLVAAAPAQPADRVRHDRGV